MSLVSVSPMNTLVVIGNHLPRQCGIATYTADLCAAVAHVFPRTAVFALAMNDGVEDYDYPERVRFTLDQYDLSAYRRAADSINLSNADVVCVQHEYGIYGGSAGGDLLDLLRDLRAPIVTTLHTVLREPSAEQRRVLVELAQLSNRLVVMSERGGTFLREIYGVAADKIDVIPHGIPDIPFLDPSFHKDQFHAEGKQVLLTFGLLSRNKGLEHVIAAMPTILTHHPHVVYFVLGTTHPHVRQHEGEAYRTSLKALARSLGVAEQVIFYDQFVAIDRLVEFIGAADIYITPYLNEAQIVSGTLAYTVGAGKAVISTPYWYAEELLADGRGMLVPFADPAAIAERVQALLDNEAERHAMRKRAYLLGRAMIWPRVAERYMASFQRARVEHRLSERVGTRLRAADWHRGVLPPINLDHLRRMSDDTGMLQHAVMAVPNTNEGYTTDDNARALIAAVKLEELGHPGAADLATRYLAFLWHAFNPNEGRFRNFMRYDRHWLEEAGSEDSHARALWALGTTLHCSARPDLIGVADALFINALPAALAFTHPRPIAFALLGLYEYLQCFPGDRLAQQTQATLAANLLARYAEHRTDDWRWFSPELTYDNAILPHALLLSGSTLGRTDMSAVGLEALAWLAALQRDEAGHMVPIGCHGFAQRGTARARFDQQPLEAHAMALATLDAWRITGDDTWLAETHRAFDWFLGRNDLGLALYDPITGGCHDGLLMDRVNQNQGAESTLAYLLTRLALGRVTDLPSSVLIAAEHVVLTPPVVPVSRNGRAREGRVR
ncbi:glycosyltransferase family 4 protein [Candidatus Chloroploca sp. Khr17]|uniref:glycosyltransferase family 4 protein n=1 Tax=Candidatus Chloroploca sp. Khr17 TaxID=2496869 RepID=UPI00196B3EE7|nr:glycosyltransferase family 4 protein [Candidatus Chloroploca sp. Khr17]